MPGYFAFSPQLFALILKQEAASRSARWQIVAEQSASVDTEAYDGNRLGSAFAADRQRAGALVTIPRETASLAHDYPF